MAEARPCPWLLATPILGLWPPKRPGNTARARRPVRGRGDDRSRWPSTCLVRSGHWEHSRPAWPHSGHATLWWRWRGSFPPSAAGGSLPASGSASGRRHVPSSNGSAHDSASTNLRIVATQTDSETGVFNPTESPPTATVWVGILLVRRWGFLVTEGGGFLLSLDRGSLVPVLDGTVARSHAAGDGRTGDSGTCGSRRAVRQLSGQAAAEGPRISGRAAGMRYAPCGSTGHRLHGLLAPAQWDSACGENRSATGAAGVRGRASPRGSRRARTARGRPSDALRRSSGTPRGCGTRRSLGSGRPSRRGRRPG